jgi:hypothetical protein
MLKNYQNPIYDEVLVCDVVERLQQSLDRTKNILWMDGDSHEN